MDGFWTMSKTHFTQAIVCWPDLQTLSQTNTSIVFESTLKEIYYAKYSLLNTFVVWQQCEYKQPLMVNIY